MLLLLLLVLLLLLLVLMNLTSSMVNIFVRVLMAVLLLSVRLLSSMLWENNPSAARSQHGCVPGRNINLKDERDVVRRVLRIWESNAVFFFVVLISIVNKRGSTVAVRRALSPQVILRTRRRRTLS